MEEGRGGEGGGEFIMLCKIFKLLLAYQELYDLKEESSEGGEGGTGH